MMADVASSQRVRDIFAHAAKHKDFVYHNLFLAFQMVFDRACSLLLSPTAQSTALDSSVDRVDQAEFASLLTTFEMVLSELLSMKQAKSLCAERYQTSPMSWDVLGSGQFRSSDEAKVADTQKGIQGAGGKKRVHGDSTSEQPSASTSQKGWIKLVDSTKSLADWNPTTKPRMCKYFVFQGSCVRGATCTFRHYTSLSDLTDADQEIVKAFIKSKVNDKNEPIFALVPAMSSKSVGKKMWITKD